MARLLTAAQQVPVVSPASLYVTGLLASAAHLQLSPPGLNGWWRSEGRPREEDIGTVVGWLHLDSETTRAELWELVTVYHMNRSQETKDQFYKSRESKSGNPISLDRRIPHKYVYDHPESPDFSEELMTKLGRGNELKKSISSGRDSQYIARKLDKEHSTQRRYRIIKKNLHSKDEKYKKHVWPKNEH